MRLICVGTGSDGNCYLIESNSQYLALDTGCPWRNVQVGCDFQVSQIDAALITHIHGDHSKYAKDFCRNGVAVYSNTATSNQLNENGKMHVHKLRERIQTRIVGGYKVIEFLVPHEGIQNSAYLVEFTDGERLLYMTDFEYCPFKLGSWNIDHFLIAVNHSEEIPEDAAAREHRLRGHSSLQTVIDFLKTSMTDKCKSITVCHMSESFADPEKILTALRELCGSQVAINIAEKGRTYTL